MVRPWRPITLPRSEGATRISKRTPSDVSCSSISTASRSSTSSLTAEPISCASALIARLGGGFRRCRLGGLLDQLAHRVGEPGAAAHPVGDAIAVDLELRRLARGIPKPDLV